MYGSGLTLLNYCANAGGSTACFAAAGDELILVADCTTAPFGFEVLVYQCGPMKVLKPAVPFKRLKAFDGPHMQFAVMFEAKQVGPGEGYRVSLYPALQSGAKWHRIGREFAVGMVRPNAPVHLVGEGVDVEVLGVDDDGVVSYRVHKTMPWQLAEIQLSVTTVTSYHVVTIYGR